MDREDWGFLLSRVLAVVIAMRLIGGLYSLVVMIVSARLSEDTVPVLLLLPLYGILAVMALYLWTGAERFGRWFGKRTFDRTPVDGDAVRSAVFGGIGLYFLANGIIMLAETLLRQMVQSTLGSVLMRNVGGSIFSGVAETVAGGLILYLSARPEAVKRLLEPSASEDEPR